MTHLKLTCHHKNELHSNIREIHAMDKIVGDMPDDQTGNFSDLAMQYVGILPFDTFPPDQHAKCRHISRWWVDKTNCLLCFENEFNATSKIVNEHVHYNLLSRVRLHMHDFWTAT